MDKLMDGKICLITGGNSGMGESCAKLFAREGATVVITGRKQAKIDKVIADITAEGGKAVSYGPIDIAVTEQIYDLVDKVVADYGRIDSLVAMAGASLDGSGLPPEEHWIKTQLVNAKSTYDSVFAVVPHMKKQGGGTIVLRSSNGAFNPTAPAFEYHMAMGACESLTVNTAMAFAADGIRVNCIIPGPIVTPFWDELFSPEAAAARKATFDAIANIEVPLKRMGTADDIGNVALFLASDMSAYVTGMRISVAGGMGYVLSNMQSALMQNPPEGK